MFRKALLLTLVLVIALVSASLLGLRLFSSEYRQDLTELSVFVLDDARDFAEGMADVLEVYGHDVEMLARLLRDLHHECGTV